jgi:hypothetical protein
MAIPVAFMDEMRQFVKVDRDTFISRGIASLLKEEKRLVLLERLQVLARHGVRGREALERAIQEGSAEHRFTEALTFASYDEIVGMLDVVLREDYVGFPVWARNLAYRLACLLQLGNAQIRRRAAEDLYRFGPDWDDQANLLLREAQDIECRR